MQIKNHILVIDDDQAILDAMQLTLEDSGYSVAVAEKGDYAETLQYASGNLPDLIILDLVLSGSDGSIICKKLKDNDHTKHIPIIIISAHPGALEAVKEAGAEGFLAKPFQVKDLLEVIEKNLPPDPSTNDER